MKVALLGVKGEFNKALGQGVQRYMYEMYARLKGMEKGASVDKVEVGSLSKLGNNLSFMLGTFLKDFDDYDIIHRMDQKPMFPLRKGKSILISTAHDFQAFLSDYGYRASSLKERAWIPINTLGMRSTLSSDYIIARSTQTRDELVDRGYDRRRITIISDGVDERYFARIPSKNNRKFTVGYLSSFALNKNPIFAVNAFKKTGGSDMIFDVWGKKAMEYNNLVKAANGDKRITFKGFAPEEKIVATYDSFDVFVFPSKYEGFGIPIIEAQARGLPVIICKDSLIPKEVRKYCFEAKDEAEMARIITELKRDGYDKRHRDMVQMYARAFTWSKTIKETLVLYKKILLNKR